MKLIVLLLGAAALLMAACGSGDDDGDGGGSGTTVAPAAECGDEPVITATQTGGKPLYSAPPPMCIDTDKQYFATIKLDAGDIKIELFPKDAPETVNSFVFLSREGFYDGVTFHRVIKEPRPFVAQTGDPTGTGSGGPGYNVKDEVNDRKFLDGTVGMAKTAQPNSAGSQFFIDYAPQPDLDGAYTVFGQVVEGREVVDMIAPRDPRTATTPGTAIQTIVIEEQ